MKPFLSIFILTLFFFAGYSSISAQDKTPEPPPAPAPDYFPDGWEEYSYADDNIRFRFPVEPTFKESTRSENDEVTHTYSRQSFMLFELTVMIHPADVDLESDERILAAAVQGGIDKSKAKVIEQKDITIDGHRAKFIILETDDGLVMRWKCFGIKNKMYVAYAIVKKGERHGFNWENDFEIPSMAFLDSLHVIDAE